MIPKANQRAGGRQLATHLLNEFDNDRVEVAELRGAVADNLHGAFDEWAAAARVTKCRKDLYSLSVNPDPDQRPVTREEYFDYIARVEKSLGLSEQPRAVVFHVKYGREHCHVVWSRIDSDRLRAVQLSHDHQKLRTLTREFARDYGIDLPPGMRADKLTDRFNKRKTLENLAEQQQEERTGITKGERMAAITAAWRETDSGKAFVAALEERGYFLARGQKGRYVVVDLYGEIHALARQIDGTKTAAVRSRLSDFPVDKLPDALRAQVFAREQLDKQRTDAPEPVKTTAETRRIELADRQRQRRAELDERRRNLFAQHRVERGALAAAQDSEEKGVLSARLRAQPKGVIAFIARITGIRLLVAYRHKKQDQTRLRKHTEQREALRRRHARETHEFQHRYRGLVAVEMRERRSLETALRRKEFRLIAGYQPGPERGPILHPQQPGLTPEQRARLEGMRRAGFDMSRPARARSPRSLISRPFNKAAAASAGPTAQESDRRAPDSNATDEMMRDALEGAKQKQGEGGDADGLADGFKSATRGERVRATAKQLREEQKRKGRNGPGSDLDRER